MAQHIATDDRGGPNADGPGGLPITRGKLVTLEDDNVDIRHHQSRGAIAFAEEFAVHPGSSGESQYAAITIPLLDDGRLVLVGRDREPLAAWSLELPRSEWLNDDGGWKRPTAAILLRDTGLTARQFRLLGTLSVDPALLSRKTVVVLAEGCRGSTLRPADAGSLVAGPLAVTPAELDELIRQGDITCGVTLAASCLYWAWQRAPQ